MALSYIFFKKFFRLFLLLAWNKLKKGPSFCRPIFSHHFALAKNNSKERKGYAAVAKTIKYTKAVSANTGIYQIDPHAPSA